MIFFVAKGSADSCGRGCSEWIAAVGTLDVDAPERLREFIQKLNGRKLPIFFHSPGGLAGSGVKIGLILREGRMAAGVGRTEAKCRVFDKKDTVCQNKVLGGDGISARLVTGGAVCASACVHAFAGASTRQVASDAFIGVHASADRMSPKRALLLTGKPDTPISKINNGDYRHLTQRYFLEMGINPDIFDFAAKTPHERMYILNRSEIARFGLETRDKIFETPWIFGITNHRSVVMKSITRRSPSEPADYLTLRFLFHCQNDGRAFFGYRREIAPGSDHPATSLQVKLGDQTVPFRAQPPKMGVETGFYFSRDQDAFLRNVASAKTIAIIESAAGDEAVLETKLSTVGLEAALGDFQKLCVKPIPLTPTPVKPVIWPRSGTAPSSSGFGMLPPINLDCWKFPRPQTCDTDQSP